MARQYESAVIFFDEVDSILSSRTADGEHEASRRMKSEMLQQIDGLSSYIDSSSRIFVLCATNFPGRSTRPCFADSKSASLSNCQDLSVE